MNKCVYVYDMNDNLVMEFETTKACAEYFDKEKEHINHNIKYSNKFRHNDTWYQLTRTKKEDTSLCECCGETFYDYELTDTEGMVNGGIGRVCETCMEDRDIF